MSIFQPKQNVSLQQTPLSQDEAQRFLDSIIDRKYKGLIYLGSNSGITLPEALALKANDINFKEQVIWVEDAEKKRHRTVVVPIKVLEYLKHTLNGNIQADVVLFDLATMSIMRDLPVLSQNAIGKPIGWACIRATYTQLAIDAGHPIDLISENTGLSKGFIVQAVNTFPEIKRELVNKSPIVVIK